MGKRDGLLLRLKNFRRKIQEEGFIPAFAHALFRRFRSAAGRVKKKRFEHKFSGMLAPLLDVPSDLTENQALEQINRYDRMEKMPFSQKTVFEIQYDLMIVVPVYNTEKYLEECITSILHQKTKYRFLAVFVNDGSTDGSDAILQRYETCPNVKVIRQENRGLSGARNRAMETMYGKYIMFVDSDDLLEEGAVEKLMDTAVREDADIVEGGYIKFGEGMQDWVQCRDFDEPVKADQSMLTGFASMKVIKSSLFQDLCFPRGIWFEDTIMQELLYSASRNVWIIPDIVYRYRQNPEGISATAQTHAKVLDTWWITKFCLEEKVQRGYLIDAYARELFFVQLQRNNRRLKNMPEEVQESVFVLSCGLYAQYFAELPKPDSFLDSCLDRALKNRSWRAYQCVMENWNAMR